MQVLVLAGPVLGLVEPRFLARGTCIGSTCTRDHRYLAQYYELSDNTEMRPRLFGSRPPLPALTGHA